MALKEKDLLAAIARLQERNAQQAKPTERMTLEEYKRMRGLLPAEGTEGKVTGVGSTGITDTINKASKEISNSVSNSSEQISNSVSNVNNETTEVSNNTNYVAQDTQDISKSSNEILNKLDNVSKDTATSVNNTEKITQSVSDKSSEGLYKESVEQGKEDKQYQKEQLDALLKLGKSFESFKSPLENLAEKLQAYKPSNLKETLLTKMNIKIPGVGGIFDKAIRKEQFIKTEKLLGSEKTKTQIGKEFESYNEQSKIIQKNNAIINKIKGAVPDASEEQLMRIPEYRKAKEASAAAAKESGKFTVKSDIMHPANEDVGSTSRKEKKDVESAEQIQPEIEPAKLKPETGQEVDFDKQKYRFLGQQWVEIDAETGKQGKMAEKGIVDHLNKLAGVDPAVNPTKKNADDTAVAERMQEAQSLAKEQTELLQQIADNTAALNPNATNEKGKEPSFSLPKIPGLSLPTGIGKPQRGKEVTFSGQKYRFQGQQWVEVNKETGKTGRIAERGITKELNKRAGMTVPETKAPTKIEPKKTFGSKVASIGGGIKDIGGGMINAAKGIAAIGASLLVLTLGLKAINTIDIESIVKAGVAVGSLVVVSKLMGDSVGSLLKGALGIAALGGAMWVASKGFAAFADIDWETLAKAGIAIGGLAVGAMAIGGAAAPILLGAAAIAGLGAAVWVLGEGLQSVGEAVDSFVSSIERLGEIDGDNLIQVGAGLAAVAAGMVAFGAANAVAGVTNLVSGFLGAVTPGKTPVEQLLEIAEAGPNINQAGTGIQNFASGLTEFSKVDKDKLIAITELPNDKIIALGEAIGRSRSTEPKAANVPTTGTPAETPTVAAAAEAKQSTPNIQAKQTAPGKYEGVASGITSDDIVNHPNYKKYYEEALERDPRSKSTEPSKVAAAKISAQKTASLKVQGEMTKEAATKPTSTAIPEGSQEKANIVAQQSADVITGKKSTLSAIVEPVPRSTANKVYGASAENAEATLAPAMTSPSTTNNVVAPTTVTNNTINSYKPDVRNQDSSFKRMVDSRYVPV